MEMHVQSDKLAVSFGLLEKPAENGMQREGNMLYNVLDEGRTVFVILQDLYTLLK